MISNLKITYIGLILRNSGTEEPIFGVNSAIRRRDEKLFRHPTRQLTSSAKAKEVTRPPFSGGFFVAKVSKKAA